MILPTTSEEIARKLTPYLPVFARPLLDHLIKRVRFETEERIALQQEERRRQAAEARTIRIVPPDGEVYTLITGELSPATWGDALPGQAANTQNVLGEAKPTAAGLEEIRRKFGQYFDRIVDVDGWTAAVRRGDDPTPYMRPGPLGQATATPIADVLPAARRLEYDERIAFIVEHLAGPTSYTGDLEDRQRQRAREELIQAAEQTD